MRMNVFKYLFCRHNYKYLRNIYGDEIIWSGFKRSIYVCAKCGKWRLENTVLRNYWIAVVDEMTGDTLHLPDEDGGLFSTNDYEEAARLCDELAPKLEALNYCEVREVDAE